MECFGKRRVGKAKRTACEQGRPKQCLHGSNEPGLSFASLADPAQAPERFKPWQISERLAIKSAAKSSQDIRPAEPEQALAERRQLEFRLDAPHHE